MPLREGYLSILWPLLPVLIAISCWFGVKAGGDNLLTSDTVAPWGIGSLARAGSVKEAQLIIASWDHRVPDWRRQTDAENKSWFSSFLSGISRFFSNQGLMRTQVARQSLVFDLFFISFYTSAMAVACLLASTEIHCRSRKRKPRLVALGIKLALVQIVTAGFDLVENLALWRMLSARPVSNPWPWIAYVCSIAKFSLLAVSLLYILIAFVFWLVDHKRPPLKRVVAVTT